MADKITFASMEGNAVIMKKYDDGRILAFERISDEWKPLHFADAVTKAYVADKGDWDVMFPGLALPLFPE